MLLKVNRLITSVFNYTILFGKLFDNWLFISWID